MTASSITSVTTSTSFATLLMSPRPSTWDSACAISLARKRNERLTSNPSKVARVIMPKPPSWNSAMITTWPKVDQ